SSSTHRLTLVLMCCNVRTLDSALTANDGVLRRRTLKNRRPAMTTEVTKALQRALRTNLTEGSLNSIISQVVKQAEGGDKESATSLIKLLEYSRSLACW